MTRDELTKRINDLGYEDYAAPLEVALLAVLELHKPLSDKMQFCMECTSQYNGESDVVA